MLDNRTFVALASLPEPQARSVVRRWGAAADETTARRHTTKRGQDRTRLARALARGLLEHATGVEAAAWTFDTGAGGKPWVRSDRHGIGPPFSISHSGEWVAVAVTGRGSLGIDMERHRGDRPLDALAAYAFGPGERREAGASVAAFYRIWTLREAMAKSTGEGLARASDGVDRVCGMPEAGAWRFDEAGRPWRLARYERIEGYSLAIAIEDDPGAGSLPWSDESIAWWRPHP